MKPTNLTDPSMQGFTIHNTNFYFISFQQILNVRNNTYAN